jgi:hypothetical protein
VSASSAASLLMPVRSAASSKSHTRSGSALALTGLRWAGGIGLGVGRSSVGFAPGSVSTTRKSVLSLNCEHTRNPVVSQQFSSREGQDGRLEQQLQRRADPALIVVLQLATILVLLQRAHRCAPSALPKCSFDPLASQRANGVPLQIFADQAADNLRRIVGNQVGIRDISISRLDYDDSTKSKINQLNAERANTATAEQAVKTAEQNRKTNEIHANQPPQTGRCQSRTALRSPSRRA